MRDYQVEFEKRVAFIKDVLAKSGAKGVVFGNSGGKDSALVGALCKAACDNTIGVIMPCGVQRNYSVDDQDAREVAERFKIETRVVDLTLVREAELKALEGAVETTRGALANIAPRLRMTTLYAIAGSEGRLVAGTGNKCETYVGYFTKWGDGSHDFNPIFDLTVSEIYDFLRYLDAPQSVISKAPSAALFDGQTDETEMGVSYAELEAYLDGQTIPEEKRARVERLHQISEHKRQGIARFGE